MVEKVCEQLRSAGIEVYLPGQREGPCTEPFAIVQGGGVKPDNRSTGRRIITISCHAPIGRLIGLQGLIAAVREAMLGLGADLRPTEGKQTGEQREPYLTDDQYSAIVANIEYAALCAI